MTAETFEFLDGTQSDFPMGDFIRLQKMGIHPEFESGGINLCTDGRFAFNKRNHFDGHILPFVLKTEGQVVGVAYTQALYLTEYPILQQRGSLFLVETVLDSMERNHPDKDFKGEVLALDLGGAFVDPRFVGQGFYGHLFEQRLRFTKEGFASRKLLATDFDQGEIDPSQLVFAICSMGKYPETFKPNLPLPPAVISSGELKGLKVDPIDIGIPRPQSAAVDHIIRKYFFDKDGTDPRRFRYLGSPPPSFGPAFSASVL